LRTASRHAKGRLSKEIASFLRKDARVRDYQRLTVEEFESRVVRSAPQVRRVEVDETAEDGGRPVRGIMLALVLGLASWAAIGVIVAAAIALF
jgi:hypothetical protein